MRLYLEKPGVLAPNRVWVLLDGPYLYVNASLWKLTLEVLREWRDDRHLVG